MNRPHMELTLQRIDLFAQIGHIADEAAGLPEQDMHNVFHSLALNAGTHGASYVERITLAAYAIAICEHYQRQSVQP